MWTIVYQAIPGGIVVTRQGRSYMEYYRLLNQLKFRDIEYLTTPPSN